MHWKDVSMGLAEAQPPPPRGPVGNPMFMCFRKAQGILSKPCGINVLGSFLPFLLIFACLVLCLVTFCPSSGKIMWLGATAPFL